MKPLDFTASIRKHFPDAKFSTHVLLLRRLQTEVLKSVGDRRPCCPSCREPLVPFALHTLRDRFHPASFPEDSRDYRILWACDTAECANGCEDVVDGEYVKP